MTTTINMGDRTPAPRSLDWQRKEGKCFKELAGAVSGQNV